METPKLLNPYSVLMDDEHRVLDKTREIRENIVDTYIQDNGIPTRSGDMRVMNEILNSLDANVSTRVDFRLKHEDSKQSEDLTDAIVGIFNKISQGNNVVDVATKNITIEDKFVPDNVVPGEELIEYQELDMDKVVPTIINNKD